MKKNKKGIVYIAFYINGNVLIGNPEAIHETMELFQKNLLVLKLVDMLLVYLSCEKRFNEDKRKTCLEQ